MPISDPIGAKGKFNPKNTRPAPGPYHGDSNINPLLEEKKPQMVIPPPPTGLVQKTPSSFRRGQ